MERRRRRLVARRRPLARAVAHVCCVAGLLAAVASPWCAAERAEAGQLRGHAVQHGGPRFVEAGWERSSQPLTAPCGSDSGLQAFHNAEQHRARPIRRLGLARAGRDGVHRRAGERQPRLPGGPPRRSRRHPPDRRRWSGSGEGQRLPRPLDRRRVHPVPQLGFTASPPVPASPAGAPRRTPPMPTSAASTCEPRTARRRR